MWLKMAEVVLLMRIFLPAMDKDDVFHPFSLSRILSRRKLKSVHFILSALTGNPRDFPKSRVSWKPNKEQISSLVDCGQFFEKRILDLSMLTL